MKFKEGDLVISVEPQYDINGHIPDYSIGTVSEIIGTYGLKIKEFGETIFSTWAWRKCDTKLEKALHLPE